MQKVKHTATTDKRNTLKVNSTNPIEITIKQQDEKEKSKDRILKAATKLFAQKGFDGVGIREICKDAKANICMISYFWGGKEGLYQGIIDNLIARQTEYAKTFLNFDTDPKTLSKKEQINLLFNILDNAIDLLYSGFISNDILKFMLQEQQVRKINFTSPTFIYIRKLVGAIFNKDFNDREIIYKTVFIISQINSPKVFLAISLSALGQKNFTKEDKVIIKNNARLYVNALLEEVK